MNEEKRDFNCNICNKSFVSKYTLAGHKMTHSDEQKYECPLCQKTFLLKGYLNQHLLMHTGEKPYKCKTCGKCFRRKGHMKQHELTHSGEKPYKCSLCSASFAWSQVLKKHQRIHANLPLLPCPLCPRKYRHREDLRHHIKTHKRSIYLPAFDCIFCNKTFKTYQGYNWHLKVHVGEARVLCGLCDKEFSGTDHKNEHIRRHHSLEKPFECKICKVRFTTQHQLKMHSITHFPADKPKRHICVFCNKGFHRCDDLFYHIKSHIKEKAYSCKDCEHETISSSNMLKHVKRVHML